jgi:hypothetical protein
MIDHDLTPEQRAELGELSQLYQHMAKQTPPHPDSERLLAVLKTNLAENEDHPVQAKPTALGPKAWLGLAWGQIRLLEAPFWWSCILLVGLGVLLGISWGGSSSVLIALLVSPLVAVLGVAYIFRPATNTLWELEQLSRISPLELLYARLAALFALNLIPICVLLAFAWTQGVQVILWRALLIWFGPMVALMGIALFCTIRWNALVGAGMATGIWGGVIFAGWQYTSINISASLVNTFTLLNFLSTSNTVILFAVLALVAGLVLLYESQNRIPQWR